MPTSRRRLANLGATVLPAAAAMAAAGDPKVSIKPADQARAKAILGWQPRCSNVRMTVDAYDWYCAHGERYRPQAGPVLRLLNALS